MEHTLRLHGSADPLVRVRKSDEERIALGAYHAPVMLLPYVPQELIVLRDHRRKFFSQMLQEAGRALDIRK
jgi:hypothetical protein